MSILVINYYVENDWVDMLPEKVEQLVMLSEQPVPHADRFAYFEHVPNCEMVSYAELKAIQLMEIYQFSDVLADNEYDLIRAGRLRERFGLSGQTEESATAFRNKVVMKDYVAKKLKVPAYKRIQNILDVYDFANDHGYPVIVKPIDQGASRGTAVLHNEEDLLALSKEPFIHDLEVESFIEGQMYHVDALVEQGEILFVSVSRYYNTCLSFKEGKSMGSIQLHPKESMFIRLKKYLLQVLEALPTPEVSAYHLEVFHTPQDELVFCEIASRVGGGLISKLLDKTYQFTLRKNWMRRAVRLPIEPPNTDPEWLHGFLFLVPKKGRLLSQPEQIVGEGVLEYQTFAQPGDILHGPKRSIDKMASLIIRGKTSQEIEGRMAEAEACYWSQVLVEEDENVTC